MKKYVFLIYLKSFSNYFSSSTNQNSSFHTDISSPLLLAQFTPKTPLHYAIACLVTFLLAVMYEAWLSLPQRVDRQFTYASVPSSAPSHGGRRGSDATAVGEHGGWRESKVARSAARGGMRIVSAALGYLLMLIVMTFNLGLFFSVVLGLGLGSALFGGGLASSGSSKNGGRDQKDANEHWNHC
ncbi:hypothetical protein HDU97_000585 [Phlyctochytrium planicorne]|nr:hypothetical protein HDU97_000585 [Phlyctochytrium planicorne]